MVKQPREEVGKPSKDRVTVPPRIPGAPLVTLVVRRTALLFKMSWVW